MKIRLSLVVILFLCLILAGLSIIGFLIYTQLNDSRNLVGVLESQLSSLEMRNRELEEELDIKASSSMTTENSGNISVQRENVEPSYLVDFKKFLKPLTGFNQLNDETSVDWFIKLTSGETFIDKFSAYSFQKSYENSQQLSEDTTKLPDLLKESGWIINNIQAADSIQGGQFGAEKNGKRLMVFRSNLEGDFNITIYLEN